MEALELTIFSYLNYESHIHLGVLRKKNAKSEHHFLFYDSLTCNMLQLRMRNVGGAMDVLLEVF